jgi:serine/threonine protein kinase
MEYMEGGSLASKLITTEPLAIDSIVRWLPPLAAALDHAHEQGVVHAGLKPTAIVFDKRDTPFVTDFAIASRPGNEKNWAVMGAPAFLAPEQWDGDMPTGKADQYSFAVVAYLLLTGSRPYEGQENPEVRRRNFARGAIPAHDEAHQNGRKGITRAASSVLARAMATKADARYTSVTEFAAALSAALDPRDRPTVFISYHRKTCTIPAIHFKEKLSGRHGISSFLDTERVDNPQPFPGRLRRAIEECDLFICLLGVATLESKWVRQEIAIAHQNNKPMVPVFQEGFIWPNPGSVEPAVDALLHQEGLELRVRRPEQIDEIIADLAHMVRNSTG